MKTLNKEIYMKEVEGKYVSRRIHPEYNSLVILNYTENVTFERRWNEITLMCRGLIIDESTGEIIARPFPKFFNYGELPEYEKDIPFNETPEFTVKQDGSLGISYKVNGKTYWSTRGSFESEQAKIAQSIWEEKYNHVVIPEEITLLVEIIDPLTRVVVDYQGLSDLIIIGAINRYTGYDFPYKELLELGEQLGMPVTEQKLLTIDEAVKLKHTIDHNSEGWVLRWSNGKRLKIKGDNYLDVHKLAYGLSQKLKTEYWKDGKIEELILKMPEEFRNEIESFRNQLDLHLNNLEFSVQEHLINAKNNSEDRKSFALYVNEKVPGEIKHLVFKGVDGKLSADVLKEHIYKNYIRYIEGAV